VDKLRKTLPLLLILTVHFVSVYADAPAKIVPIQEQILQQINSLLHAKPNLSLELDKKQIVEYSLIGAIALVVIITIASSARSKTRKPKMT
jgi:hypothetical protein